MTQSFKPTWWVTSPTVQYPNVIFELASTIYRNPYRNLSHNLYHSDYRNFYRNRYINFSLNLTVNITVYRNLYRSPCLPYGLRQSGQRQVSPSSHQQSLTARHRKRSSDQFSASLYVRKTKGSHKRKDVSNVNSTMYIRYETPYERRPNGNEKEKKEQQHKTTAKQTHKQHRQ